MIIYDLDCENAHRFEGWFRSAQDFDQQLAQHLISCPQCESQRVRRVPSAVAIGSQGGEREHSGLEGSATSSGAASGSAAAMAAGNADVLTMCRQLIKAVVEHTEDVGDAFASEARKIHYQEAPERPIRGQATADECDALRDEGIEIFSLPHLKDEELN